MFLVCVQISRCARILFCIVGLVAAAATARAGFNVFEVGGNNTTASIQPTVDAFRAALGDPNHANAPGPLFGGRREINWDGGGSATASPAGTPFTGFQNT